MYNDLYNVLVIAIIYLTSTNKVLSICCELMFVCELFANYCLQIWANIKPRKTW